METGRVVEWLKQDGDRVEAGELIFAVESDKAITEVEALDSGILRIPPGAELGVEVPVGAVLAYIVAEGEPAPFELEGASVASPVRTMAGATLSAPPLAAPGPRSARNGQPAISPRARRAAERLGIDWITLTGSGSTGRIRERDILAAAAAHIPKPTETRAAPTVRRLADQLGVDLARVEPSLPSGRIRRADLLAALPEDTAAEEPVRMEHRDVLRQVIAERLSQVARAVVPVTLTTDADVTELVRIREQLKVELEDTRERVPSYTDLAIRLCALALRRHPDLNASFLSDRVVRHDAIHLGIAVDTDRGLMVPVIRNADRQSLMEIAALSARLIDAARAGTIAADDLRGGTFTVTNLGMYGIDAFTPVINLPECAILGLGRIVARPVVIDELHGTIAARKMMALSLTFDHRVVDGAPAARFLQDLKRMMERPYLWLLR